LGTFLKHNLSLSICIGGLVLGSGWGCGKVASDQQVPGQAHAQPTTSSNPTTTPTSSTGSAAHTTSPPTIANRPESLVKSKQYRVEGFQLSIASNNDSCALKFENSSTHEKGTLPLTIKPPCYFVLNAYDYSKTNQGTQPKPSKPGGILLSKVKGEPLVWRYKQEHDVSVVIVVGSPEPTEDPERAAKIKKYQCGSERQGVLLTASDVKLSKRVASGSQICAQVGEEEKEFWLFAHSM
jgi:hypothetical protein